MHWAAKGGLVLAGLLLLALVVWGISTALSSDKPDPGTGSDADPGASAGIRFVRFDTPVSGNETPWCTATRYRVTYITNGLESDPRPHIDVRSSLTDTDPVVTLKRPATIHEVKWYRAEAADNYAVWRDHTSKMEKMSGTQSGESGEQYVDRLNPCDGAEPPRLEPPPKPEPFGAFEGMWNQEAGDGGLPWCVPTKYRARYRRGDQVSEWSEDSVEFRSQTHANPGVRVEPRDGFTVEWVASSTITLPAGNSYSGRTPDFDAQNFSFSHLGDDNVREEWNFWLDLGAWWAPGSKSLTMLLKDFVLVWNKAVDADPSVGKLRINADGLLEIEPFVSDSSPTAELDQEDWPGWWKAMGFNRTEPTNVPIVASRVPTSDILFTGEQFVDTQTWCTTPNRPLSVGFSARAGPDKAFAWCKTTAYQFAHVLDGVEIGRSPPSVPVQDDVKTDPVFQIVEPAVGTVKWYRTQDGRVVDHTVHMMKINSEVPGTARFVDMANPCQTPYVPSGPSQPRLNGVFGDNMWNQEAGDGVAPWCEATMYVARYVSDTFTGDWSSPSVIFQSTQFTVPSLVVDPEPGHTVEWGRKSPSFIILPCFLYDAGERTHCDQRDELDISGPHGITHRRVIFSSFFPDWSPGRNHVWDLAQFVTWWNTPVTGGLNIGRLEVLRSGKLALTMADNWGPGTFRIVRQTWWEAMGFPLEFTWSPVLEAIRLPNGSTGDDSIEIIGTGESLKDFDNPCS